mgnify:CR=1 FL=1
MELNGKLFAQEESYGTNIVKRMNQYISLCYKGNMLSVSEGQILAVVQGIGMVLVLWCGTSRVIYGDMTLGTLFLFASLMNYFISPVQNLIGLQPQLQEACIAMDRLNDILNATPEKNFIQEHFRLLIFVEQFIMMEFLFAMDIENGFFNK